MKMLNEILAGQNLKTLFTLFTPVMEKEYSFLLKEIKGFLHGHPEVIRILSEKTRLSEEEMEERLDHYVTVLAVSAVGGWHLGKRINHVEGFRGALIGGGAGALYLIGEHLLGKLSEEGVDLAFLDTLREKFVPEARA